MSHDIAGDNGLGAASVGDEHGEQEQFYQATVTIRAKLCYAVTISRRLNEFPDREALFRTTCFGAYLDAPERTSGDPGLVHALLQMQVFPDGHDDDVMRFEVGGYHLHFGPEEFCLLSGLTFGELPLMNHVDEHSFRQRLLPDLPMNVHVKLGHLTRLFEGPGFQNLSDIDGVRLASVLMVFQCFVGYLETSTIDAYILKLVEDLEQWNRYPWETLIWNCPGLKLKTALLGERSKHKEIVKQ